jgi:hypothetical protein
MPESLHACHSSLWPRVDRSPKHSNKIDGFVVAIGTRWVLIAQTMNGGFPDGHVAVRLRDISAVRTDTSFESRLARTLPEWPPSPPSSSIDLDSTAGVVHGLGADNVLIGVEKEKTLYAQWIGVVDEISSGKLWLWEVRPDATWHDEPLGYKLKEITSAWVGNRYLTGLQTILDLDAQAN